MTPERVIQDTAKHGLSLEAQEGLARQEISPSWRCLWFRRGELAVKIRTHVSLHAHMCRRPCTHVQTHIKAYTIKQIPLEFIWNFFSRYHATHQMWLNQMFRKEAEREANSFPERAAVAEACRSSDVRSVKVLLLTPAKVVCPLNLWSLLPLVKMWLLRVPNFHFGFAPYLLGCTSKCLMVA